MLFLTLLFTIFCTVFAADEGKFMCNHVDPTGKTPGDLGSITITLSLDNEPTAVYAKDKTADCGTSTTGTGKKVLATWTGAGPYVIKFTLGIADKANCGIDTTTTQSSSTVTIIADYSSSNLMNTPNLAFNFACDWSSAKPVAEKTSAAFEVTGSETAVSPATLTKAAIEALLTLEIRDAATTPAVQTTLKIGTLIGIYIKLDTSNLIQSLKGTDLEADNVVTVDSSIKKTLIDADGCGTAVSIKSTTMFATTEKCVVDTAVTETGFRFYKCGSNFKAFRFTGTIASVFFKIKVHVCATTTDAACTIAAGKPCTGAGGAGKRKRDAQGSTATNRTSTTMLTSINVLLNNEFLKKKKVPTATLR